MPDEVSDTALNGGLIDVMSKMQPTWMSPDRKMSVAPRPRSRRLRVALRPPAAAAPSARRARTCATTGRAPRRASTADTCPRFNGIPVSRERCTLAIVSGICAVPALTSAPAPLRHSRA